MRKDNIISLLLFLCMFPIFINAQTIEVKGKIVSDKNSPIELANIRIINQDSVLITGGTTDLDGIYSIILPNSGDFILLASYIGYKNKYISLKGIDSSVDIGTIKLIEDDSILDEIVITSSQLINQFDKAIIFPTELNKKHASNGFELLNNMLIPQLNVNLLDKQVSVRGKAVTLMINGRPISNEAEVTGLRPEDILRVEYHDMPTGVFSEYEFVVDFITRQYSYGGYIGIDATQQLSYNNGNYLSMARLNRKYAEYSFVYTTYYKVDKNIRRNINEIFYYPDKHDLYRQESGLPSIERKQAHHAFFNYNYRKDSVQLNIKTGYKNVQSPENHTLSNQLYEGRFNQTKNIIDISNERNSSPYLSFYSHWKLKNSQEFRIRGSIDYLRNYYNRYYEEKQEEESVNSFNSKVNEDFYSSVLGLTYIKRYTKGRDISFIATNFTDISKSKYEGISNNSDRLLMSETLYFFNLSKKWKKLFLSLRLGGSSLFQSQRDTKNKHYWSYRPGITMRYIINTNNMFQYRLQMNNSFPVMVLYNNVEQPIDFLQIRRGNPSLKIQRILDNRFNYSFTSNLVNFDFVFNHVHTSPGIIRQVNYDGEHFIHSYLNYGTHNVLNSEVGIALKLIENKVNLRVNAGLNHYLITGERSYEQTNPYLNPIVMVLFKNFNINMFYYSPRKGLYPTSDKWSNSERYGLSATYSNKGFSLSLGTQNPFSKYRQVVVRNFGDYYSKTHFFNSQNDHLYYIKFNYNLSFGQKHKYSDLDINGGINSAIMKGSRD